MERVESVIRTLAALTGMVILAAPILKVVRQAGRAKGLSTGRAAFMRSWPGVLLVTAGFVTLGVVLWKPLPVAPLDPWPLVLTLTGALLYFPALTLYGWGLATLGAQFGVSGLLGAGLYEDHKLVTHGPFAFMRHPMYFGVLLAAAGALLIFHTWAMVLFAPMSLVVLGRARREESLLARHFGDEWAEYAKRVPMWLPGL
jgi:protein-S-isoprenylcysteine O-methyltransferase Ste14